ncbi:MAG TPA: diguanylate cyclase [Acidobacteriaceae bacterium]|nr:diguanylate cyclase [Acidobacteriaceae bacterium]
MSTHSLPDQAIPEFVPRVLHLEDKAADRELVSQMIWDAGIRCEIHQAETRDQFVDKLTRESWDLILADYSLPTFDGFEALRLARKLCPATPFIFVTGTLGEDEAVESMKGGATDYVLKQRMKRLPTSVRRALAERAQRLQRQQVEAELRRSEEQLRFLAYHDSLTGLPNRALLQERLPQILAAAARRGEGAALLYIDLDNFKNINDSLGHSAGDVLLREVARRLNKHTRAGDMVGRLGGDEFLVVLSAVSDTTDPAIAAGRIQKGLADEFTIEGRTISLSSSIGISVFPANGEDYEMLLKNADAALFSAKEEGRNQWQFFAPEMTHRAMERLSIEAALRHALRHEQLFLEYQPQFDLSSGKMIGAEALLRWRHPAEGLIPPDRFIPVAESTGAIIPIGAWALRTACLQAKQWQAEGFPSFTMAVNISAIQVRHGSLPSTIKAILDETGLAPECLELEVTESLLLTRDHKVDSQMQALRALGVRMAIDDFGTGYSSFSYVRRFRFDRLKLDGSFVKHLNVDPNDTEITAGMIGFGAALRMEVLAECVETKEQLETLRSLGCDQAQGYYFARPLSANAFSEMLRSQPAPLPAPPSTSRSALAVSRKRLGMAISLSEALMESLPAVVCIFNASGQVRRCNTNFLGYSVDEMLQAGMMRTIAPQSLESVQRVMKDAFEQGKVETEALLVASNGAQIPCYLTGVRIIFEGEPCILGIAIDLSRQKQAEEESRRCEEATAEAATRFRAIFDSVQTGILIIDPATHQIVDANPAALQVIKFPRDRVLGAVCHQFICPAQRGMCPITDLGQTLDNAERVLLTASGEKRHIVKTVVTVQIAGRDHLLESFVDITARKEAGLALERNEADLKAALRAANMGVWSWTQATGALTWDENFYRIAGRDPKLPPPHFQELQQFYTPESWARLMAAVESALATGTSCELDLEVVRPDGSTRWTVAHCRTLRDDAGRVVGMCGTAQDITERKHLENSLKLFRMLIDQASDAIEVVDPETLRYLDVNETACLSLGYTREELLSMRVPDVNPRTEETQDGVNAELQETGSAQFEGQHRRKDGSIFPVEVKLHRVQLDRAYVVSTARDITERRRAKEVIEHLARTDPLTGLANRRVLDETLPREIARAERLHESLSVVFADLDHFKSTNDRFGHQAGDEVLRCVAAILRSELRSYALASRYGGDEFILLLPGTASDAALIVAERIREKVAASTVPECPGAITLSLGVATFQRNDSGEALVARADGALYQAKEKGGDRVEVARAVAPQPATVGPGLS